MSRWFFVSVALLCLPVPAQSQGVSAYLPLDLPPQVSRQVERVLLLADQPLVRRPIAIARVRDALPRACAIDAVLCAQVERFLERFTTGFAVTDAQVEVAASGHVAIPLPNRRGLDANDHWSASATAQWRPDPHVLIGMGAVAHPGDTVPTGSVVSVGFPLAQLDIGYRDRWSSALSDSSFLISSEAPTMPSVTLSNTRPMGRMGFSYELSVSRMSWSDRIAYQGRYTAGHPLLAGSWFGIEPVPGWSMGISRQMQFGGGERGGRSANDLFKAFVDPNGYDNTRAGSSTDNEFGNQQAAWTSSFIYPGRKPIIISVEYAGEDTSHSTAGRLGNAALSLGLRFPRLWRDIGLTYEISEWQNGWNVHHIYQDGLTNAGRSLGHWGTDQRTSGDGVGGRSQMLRLERISASGVAVELQLRTLNNAGYSGVDYHRANELGVRYSMPMQNAQVGAELLLGRDVWSKSYVRMAAFARLQDSGAGSASLSAESGSPGSSHDAAIFADLGMALSRVRIDVDHRTVPKDTTGARAAPHVGLGVRRAVGERSDLGARIELDRVDDHTLLALRAIDYRYRLHGALAFTVFAGAARYDLATPAYGYYVGTGVQWRNILPRWDLNLDLRYGDKVARDHLLPQEVGLKEPDSFYDIHSVSLSMSRSF